MEFDLILPVLMVALAGLTDHGLLVYDSDALENAACTDAQYALTSSTTSADDTGITNAALTALSDSSGVTVTISVSMRPRPRSDRFADLVVRQLLLSLAPPSSRA